MTLQEKPRSPWGLFIILIWCVSIMGSFYLGLSIENQGAQQETNPMILVEFIEWGEDATSPNNYLFDYWVYNFGDVEAKNVTILCQIQDEYENLIVEKEFNIGNIASNSVEFQESEFKANINENQEVYGLCELKSVSGEYINLLDRLNE